MTLQTSADRPSVQVEDGLLYVRASALGGCLRALVASGRGEPRQPTPEWMQKKFDEGHAAEPMERELARALLRDGEGRWEATEDTGVLPVINGQHAVHLDFGGVGSVIGTVDDVFVDGDKMILAEYKAMGPSYMNKLRGVTDPKKFLDQLPPQYRMQLSIYMWGMQQAFGRFIETHIFCCGKDAQGVLSMDSEVCTVKFTEPPLGILDIEDRVNHIFEFVVDHPEKPYPKCDVDQYPCEFYLIHDEDDTEVLEGPEAWDMQIAVRSLNSAKAQEEEGKLGKVKAYARIREILDERKKVRVPSDPDYPGFTVTWVHQDVAESVRTVKAHSRDFPKVTPTKEE
jgi:hypothetical protein